MNEPVNPEIEETGKTADSPEPTEEPTEEATEEETPVPDVWHLALKNKPHLWSMSLQNHLLYNPKFFNPGFAGLTKETYPLLLQETQGVFRVAPGESIRRLGNTPEDLAKIAAIAAGEIACPMCGSKGEAGQVHRMVIGKQTGVRVNIASPCYCVVYHRIGRQWTNPAHVPVIHRDSTWAAFIDPKNPLRDRFRLKEDAFKLIRAAILAHPGYNMLLCGPGGAGKTTLMTVLYDRALRNWAADSYDRGSSDPAVWKCSATALMSQHMAWANRPREENYNGTPTPIPIVMEEKVLNALNQGFTPHIAISEFDKYKLNSDFQKNVIHNIVNVTQENAGQVICDSNLGLNALLQNLTQQHGPPMIRRLIGKPFGMYIDFWSGKVYVNGVRQKLGYNGELIALKEEVDLGIPDTDPSETFKPEPFHSKKATANNSAPSTSSYTPQTRSSGGSSPSPSRTPASLAQAGRGKFKSTRNP